MTVVWLEIQRANGTVDKRAIDPQGHVGIASGACPGCGANPFCVVGGNKRIHNPNMLKADGRCKKCGDAVGYVFARVDTIFGLEEDRAVLDGNFGRCRGYS